MENNNSKEIHERIKEIIMNFGDGDTEFNTRDIEFILRRSESLSQLIADGETVYRKVSVKERLPEKSEILFVIDNQGYGNICQYSCVAKIFSHSKSVNDSINYWLEPIQLPKQRSGILFEFIAEIKKEFADQNWDYLDFIAERVLNAKQSDIGKSIEEKETVELFNKYYEYVYTTDDGEQRGEWKRDFARKIIELTSQPTKQSIELPSDEQAKEYALNRSNELFPEKAKAFRTANHFDGMMDMFKWLRSQITSTPTKQFDIKKLVKYIDEQEKWLSEKFPNSRTHIPTKELKEKINSLLQEVK